MGRDTGHLRVVSPGIFYQQFFTEKLFKKTMRRTEYFCCKQHFASLSSLVIPVHCVIATYNTHLFSFIFN